jgi:hypothetical protein
MYWIIRHRYIRYARRYVQVAVGASSFQSRRLFIGLLRIVVGSSSVGNALVGRKCRIQEDNS